MRLHLQNNQSKRTGGVAQALEHLICKCEALLSSIAPFILFSSWYSFLVLYHPRLHLKWLTFFKKPSWTSPLAQVASFSFPIILCMHLSLTFLVFPCKCLLASLSFTWKFADWLANRWMEGGQMDYKTSKKIHGRNILTTLSLTLSFQPLSSLCLYSLPTFLSLSWNREHWLQWNISHI
jgi:hypothetical protein